MFKVFNVTHGCPILLRSVYFKCLNMVYVACLRLFPTVFYNACCNANL